MFERFTPEARQIVVAAQVAAKGRAHCWIGTEHLLLALAGAEDDTGQILRTTGVTVAAIDTALADHTGYPFDDRSALASLGIDLDAVRDAVESRFGPGALQTRPPQTSRWSRVRRHRRPCTPSRFHVPFTPRAKRALEQSLRQALKLKDNHIGTEHLLLGVLTETGGMSAWLLDHLGVEPSLLRDQVIGLRRRSA